MAKKDDKIRQLQSEVEHLNSLAKASRLINSTLNLDELMEIIRMIGCKELGAERATIYLVDDNKEELHSVYLEDKSLKINLPYGVGIAGTVAKTGESLIIEDVKKDKRFFGKIDKISKFETKSCICVPMHIRGEKLIGVFQVLNSVNGIFSNSDLRFLEDLSILAAIAIENARLHTEVKEKEKIEQTLKLARNIQMGLLPKQFPPFPDKSQFEIYASIEPAVEVGGDFYDFFLIDDEHLCLVIGDVSGKGIPAALFMAVAKTLIKAYTIGNYSSDEILFKVNNELCEENEQEMFVTIFHGILNIHTGELRYSNGGHNPPYILYSDGTFGGMESTGGMALGVMEDVKYGLKKIRLSKKDTIYLYTDGVNETMDGDGNEFSYDRLENFFTDIKSSSATEMTKMTMETINRFINDAPQSDDITIMALKYLQ